MKKYILGMIVMLAMVGSVMAADDTATAGASVSINEFIDISITKCAGGSATEISYGSQDPGAADVTPVDCNDATNGDLKVTVEDTTNVQVTVKISGIDYAGPGAENIPVGQTKYAEVVGMTGAVAFTTSPVAVWTSMGGTGSAATDDLWFELDIPGTFLTAGAYTSTYTIDATVT